MRTMRYPGSPGYEYLEIEETNLDTLLELQKQYTAMKKRTWLYDFDSCKPSWILTVEKVKP